MCAKSALGNRYSVSICSGGHATVQLGRVAVYLEIEELRAFLHAAGEVLRDYDGLPDSTLGIGPLPSFQQRH